MTVTVHVAVFLVVHSRILNALPCSCLSSVLPPRTVLAWCAIKPNSRSTLRIAKDKGTLHSHLKNAAPMEPSWNDNCSSLACGVCFFPFPSLLVDWVRSLLVDARLALNFVHCSKRQLSHSPTTSCLSSELWWLMSLFPDKTAFSLLSLFAFPPLERLRLSLVFPFSRQQLASPLACTGQCCVGVSTVSVLFHTNWRLPWVPPASLNSPVVCVFVCVIVTHNAERFHLIQECSTICECVFTVHVVHSHLCLLE